MENEMQILMNYDGFLNILNNVNFKFTSKKKKFCIYLLKNLSQNKLNIKTHILINTVHLNETK